METRLPHWIVGKKAPAICLQEGNALYFRTPIASQEKRTRYEAIVIL